MSEQEQDAATGRMVREHADRKRKLAAMTAELERLKKAFESLANCLGHNVHTDFNLTTTRREIEKEPLSQFDFGKLIGFLVEFTELRQSVESGEARLGELGLR